MGKYFCGITFGLWLYIMMSSQGLVGKQYRFWWGGSSASTVFLNLASSIFSAVRKEKNSKPTVQQLQSREIWSKFSTQILMILKVWLGLHCSVRWYENANTKCSSAYTSFRSSILAWLPWNCPTFAELSIGYVFVILFHRAL